MRAMPTAAKLVAALAFAAVAYVVAGLYEPALDIGQRGRYFLPASGVLGLFVGWFIMGRNVGASYAGAASRGIATSVWLVFWAAFWFSGYEMILRALDKRYREVTQALGSMLEIGYYYVKLAISLEVVGALVIGGMIGGMLSEFAHRRWR